MKKERNLYLVVHHKEDPTPNWSNSWNKEDENLLDAITTTIEIGGICDQAKKAGRRIFVHRCAWGGYPHLICCSASVAQVDQIDPRSSLVKFEKQERLNVTPPISPRLGQNFYWA
jgi:hypothetical protein